MDSHDFQRLVSGSEKSADEALRAVTVHSPTWLPAV